MPPIVCFMGTLLLLVPSFKFTYADTVEMWKRTSGLHSDGRVVKKTKFKKLNLSKYKTQTKSVFDIHDEKKQEFKGIRLNQIISKKSLQQNTALLHFDNGMVIPVSYKPSKSFVYNVDDIFIATFIKIEKKWSKKFSPITRKGLSKYEVDPSPTPVVGNRPVFIGDESDFFFKSKEGVRTLKFTPWAHNNGLKAIEIVDLDAYYAQFDIAKKQSDGFSVYLNRCQYCHGLQSVGASYGWDYKDPVNVAKKRDAVNVHMFVKYPKLQPFNSKMPNQIDFSDKEASDVWKWLDAVQKEKVAPYKV